MTTETQNGDRPFAEEKEIALRVREHIIRMSTDGGCFIGASLSCADLLVHLYKNVLDVTKSNLDDPERDYLLLSKGHDVPALYATLVELGILNKDVLSAHLKPGKHIYWHPNTNIDGIEFHSGSLGHLLSVGLGIALDKQMNNEKGRVFVVLGDGELNEGSVWEALLVARARGAYNLVPVVDRNFFQANMQTEELVPLEDLGQKFKAFGWNVTRFDGHDFTALNDAFGDEVGTQNDKFQAFIADTVRGKGLPSIEARADRWFVNFDHDEVESLLRELHGEASAELHSEPLIVR